MSHRDSTLRIGPLKPRRGGSGLGVAVQRALRCSSTLVAAGLVVSARAQAGPFPAVFELSGLDGSNGFVVTGAVERDRTGYSVAAAGDVNGDGIGDFLVGAHEASPHGQHEGETYVLFGDVSVGAGGGIDLATLDVESGFILNGAPGDRSGFCVSGADDFNGDALADVLTGAFTADPHGKIDAGRAYLVFGGPEVGNTGSLELTSLDGSNGFTMNGNQVNGLAGGSLSNAGDVNGDGFPDIIIGANWANPGFRSKAGQSYVVFGGPKVGANGTLELITLNGSNGFILNGIDPWDFSARAVGAAGDVNGDGFDDVIIGAFNASPNGIQYAGETYLVFGGPEFPAQLELSALNGANGFVMNCFGVVDYCGISVSGVGDVNGDGFDDVVTSAIRGDLGGDVNQNFGETYVVFGGPAVGAGGSLDLDTLDGSNGFALPGVSPGDQSGWQVSRAGDLNGDGIDDLVIGAAYGDPGGRTDAGETYVVYGRPGLGAEGVFELASLDGDNGFVLNGIDPGDHSGLAATTAGDVNGDGLQDLIIGAYEAAPDGKAYAGEAYVVFGRASVDTDDDGIADAIDNCTVLANADQRDTDADGYGNACDPDLDDSGFVNFTDLGLLKSVFFTNDTDADFDGDGNVNFADLGTMKSFFFQPPGPSGQAE